MSTSGTSQFDAYRQLWVLAGRALWLLGTLGRASVFGLALAGIEAWDNWSASVAADGGGPSMIFVLVWPVEFGLAGLWAAVDAWRCSSWPSLAVRWCLVGGVAGLGTVWASIHAWSSYPVGWDEVVSELVTQVLVVAGGAAFGAALMKLVLTGMPRSSTVVR